MDVSLFLSRNYTLEYGSAPSIDPVPLIIRQVFTISADYAPQSPVIERVELFALSGPGVSVRFWFQTQHVIKWCL